MNQPTRKSRATYRVEILALRSFEPADRVAAGEFGFIDGVDMASEWAGLPEAVGDHGGRRLCHCEAANMTGIFRYVLHRDVAGRLAEAGDGAARPTIGQSADVGVRRLLHRW